MFGTSTILVLLHCMSGCVLAEGKRALTCIEESEAADADTMLQSVRRFKVKETAKPISEISSSADPNEVQAATGVCPTASELGTGSTGKCVEMCIKDDDCKKEGKLCCSNGCGHVCAFPVEFGSDPDGSGNPVLPASCTLAVDLVSSDDDKVQKLMAQVVPKPESHVLLQGAGLLILSYDERIVDCCQAKEWLSSAENINAVHFDGSPPDCPSPEDKNAVKQFDCEGDGKLGLQSHSDGGTGETEIRSLNIQTGEYETFFKLPNDLTTPPFKVINSCAINPKDSIIHCSMEIDSKGSFLVRINEGQVGYVAKLPGWRYGAAFDHNGTYFMHGSDGLSFIKEVQNMPTLKSWAELPGAHFFSPPVPMQMGADLALLEDETSAEYLVSIIGSSVQMVLVPQLFIFMLPTVGLPPTAVTWGTAWNFKSGIYFSADTGEGVYKLNVSSIKVGTNDPVIFTRVGNATSTEWNDGFSCMDAPGPF